MARTYSVEFNIGAALGSSFRRSMGTAQDRMQKLGATMRGMEKQRFAAGQVEKYSQELKELRARQQQAGYGNKNLNRKIAETQRKFREATREAEKHGVEIGQAAKQYRQLGTAMEQAERRMGRMQKRQQNQETRQQVHGQIMGVAAAGAAVAFPIRQAMEFESKMADVKKVMDFETPGQFKALSGDVLNLSTRLPMAASGIGDIVAAAGQAGIARDELTAFAETAVKMGTAFDMTGRVAGKTMAGWRAAMGLSQEETEELADAVNHLSNNMNAEAGELSRVINRQGAAAQAAGLHKTEVAALGATLLTSNQGAERTATALKKVTNTLTAGSQAPKRIKSSLQQLGFTAEGMAKRMQEDAQGAIKSVFQALKELPEAARPGMLQELFGKESQGVIAPLLGNMENMDQAFRMVSERTRYAGSMQAEYAERAKTTSNQMQIFRNRVTKLGITFGSILLPPLNTVMGIVGKGASTVADLAQQFPTLTKLLVGSAAALVTFKVGSMAARYGQTLLSDAVQAGKATFDFFRPSVLKANAALAKQRTVAMGLAAKQWLVTAATKAWAGAQWLVNSALYASPIGWIIAGVTALGAAGLALYKYWEPVAGFFKGLWSGISEGVSPVIQSLQPLFSILSPLGSALGWVWSQVKKVASWFGSLLSPVDESAESVKKATNAGEMFGRIIGSTITGGLRLAKQAFLNFTPLGWIIQAFGPVRNWLSSLDFFQEGKKVLGTLVSGIKSVATKPAKAVGKAFSTLREYLPFSNAKRGPLSDLFQAGRKILGTIISGIKSVATKPAEMVGKAFSKVREYLPFSDAKRGPLADLTASGRAMMDTLGQGIRQAGPRLEQAAEREFGRIVGPQATARLSSTVDGMPSLQSGQGQSAGSSAGGQVTIYQTFQIDGSTQEPETEIRRAGQEAAKEGRRAVEDYFQRGVRLGYA